MYELDKRTLIDINGSLLVTLPISWIRHNALKKGQKVSVLIDDGDQSVIRPIDGREHCALPDTNLGELGQAAASNTPEAVTNV